MDSVIDSGAFDYDPSEKLGAEYVLHTVTKIF
jgi:hypothetical protein